MSTNNANYSLSVGMNDLERMTILGEIYMPDCIDFLMNNGLKKGLNELLSKSNVPAGNDPEAE